MTQPANSPPPPVADPDPPAAGYPTWPEYLLLLAGGALSLLLTEWLGLRAVGTDQSPAWVTDEVLRVLPYWLFLPVGVVLFWPVFFAVGRLRGRSPDLSLVEWVWGTLWLLDLVLVSGIALYYLEGSSYVSMTTLSRIFGPLLRVLVLSLAPLALLVGVAGRWLRVPRPWTHHFGVALLLWPLLPLLLTWLGRVELEL